MKRSRSVCNLWPQQWSKVQQVDLSRLQAVQSLAYGSLSSGTMPWRTQDPFQKGMAWQRKQQITAYSKPPKAMKVDIPYFSIQRIAGPIDGCVFFGSLAGGKSEAGTTALQRCRAEGPAPIVTIFRVGNVWIMLSLTKTNMITIRCCL